MRYLELVFQNMEPLRIGDDDTSQHGQTNTLSYIPGSTIRGVVIHALSEKKEFSQIKKALFSDRIHFMNACLQREDKKMIPSFKGFYEDKTVCEGKKPIENVLTGDVTPGTKRASLGRYCYPEGDCIFYGDVELGEDMNINLGREGKKNVYRSQYIRKNQRFTSFITFHDMVDEKIVNEIQKVFSGVVYMGNSRHSGYGACSVIKASMKEGMPYEEFRRKADRNRFYMVLLSNMCMRNAYGELTGLDLEILAEKLGCGPLRQVRCATSVVEVFGYNRSWKGSVPSAAMYEAGSVFCMETVNHETILADRFRRLEEQGLGIRRNEGFGQILFYDDYEKLLFKQPMERNVSLEGKDRRLPDACQMEKGDLKIAAKGLLEHRLERAMEQYLVENPSMLQGISNSKLGVIQSLCLELRYVPEEAEKRLRDYIRHSEDKDQRSSRHNGKERPDVLHRYVKCMLDNDLMERLHIDVKHGKILGLDVTEVLTKDEQLRYKLQLMIDQIRYANREVKKYAD